MWKRVEVDRSIQKSLFDEGLLNIEEIDEEDYQKEMKDKRTTKQSMPRKVDILKVIKKEQDEQLRIFKRLHRAVFLKELLMATRGVPMTPEEIEKLAKIERLNKIFHLDNEFDALLDVAHSIPPASSQSIPPSSSSSSS